MCGGCVAFTEASQAPAAFAAGVAFVGTAGWATVKSALDKWSNRAADHDLEPADPEAGSMNDAEPNDEPSRSCADLVETVHRD